MKKKGLHFQIMSGIGLLLMLLAAPLTGVLLRGETVAPYLQFPPGAPAVDYPSFSWVAFGAILLFIILTTWPFWKRMGRGYLGFITPHKHLKFPIWGWIAIAALTCFWILAWTRFSWFESFQRYTFFPIWFSFILTLNAVALKISGRSLMTRFPAYFTLLFPASAAFWWFFEYLNRFVNNWHYLAASELSSWQYFLEASLAFSTVLPAVMSLFYIVLQVSVFRNNFNNFPAIPWLTSGWMWTVLGMVSIAGLIGTGWQPEYFFPLLWIAPGVLWISFQQWKGYVNPVLKQTSEGNFTLVWSSAIAALVCGFFWEMWNFFSLAKWQYNVPGIEKFYLFEMPALGYAGYLPFGVICLLISHSLFTTMAPGQWMIEKEVI
ncbi:MAG: hypothetical protein WEA56_04600 [Balneolaceae bacterium]